jgi:hypothetical protein
MSRSANLEEALRDPASVFATPEEVATEDGMPGGDGDLLRRILLALDGLIGGNDAGDSGPTKQHALLRRRNGRK